MDRLIDLVPLPYTDAVVALGSAVLGVTAGVLGAFAVLRGRSLVGDALSHAALPGVAVAFIATGAKDTGTLLVGAGLAGMIGALLMVAIERTSRIRPDAAIGVVLSGFFSLGIVLLTYIAGLNDADQAGLDAYLFGQAAGLLERDLAVMGGLSLASLAAVAVGFRACKVTLFDPAFAGAIGLPVRVLEAAMTGLVVVAVVVGVRTVGAILMVALLVVPSVAARQLTGGLARMLVLAGAIGAAVGVGGSLLSMRAEVPTGPVIVLVGFGVVLLSVLLSPGRGVLWRAGRLRRERRLARTEGVLVDLATAAASGTPVTERELVLSGGRAPAAVRSALCELRRRGQLVPSGRRLALSADGARAAETVQDRHRLWTLWLEHGTELRLPDAREPGPHDVQTVLGEAEVAQLRALGGEREEALR